MKLSKNSKQQESVEWPTAEQSLVPVLLAIVVFLLIPVVLMLRAESIESNSDNSSDPLHQPYLQNTQRNTLKVPSDHICSLPHVVNTLGDFPPSHTQMEPAEFRRLQRQISRILESC